MNILGCGQENIALNKPATMSTTQGPWAAGHGVDGKFHETQSHAVQYCMHTRAGAEQWWMVNLGQPYYIHSVEIINRFDCCCECTTV